MCVYMYTHIICRNIEINITFKYKFRTYGESKTVQKGPVSATAWQDRKVVMAMAINCQPSAVGEVQRRKLDGSVSHVHRLSSSAIG